jgi:hypothetical protein
MTVIRRISPASAFKVGLIVNGFLGLILGAFCTVTSIAGVAFARQAHIALFGVAGAYVGFFAVILCPVLYGLIGGVGAAIGAAMYNLASGWIGGLEIEIT